MENLIIQKTDDTPNVVFDLTKNVFEISGRSFPEDAAAFYTPIINWLTDYSKKPSSTLNFACKLEYFNTSSSKQIYQLLSVFKSISEKSQVAIFWHYEKGDKDMHSVGLRYEKLIGLSFNFIEDII